jgi:hypothetical protein
MTTTSQRGLPGQPKSAEHRRRIAEGQRRAWERRERPVRRDPQIVIDVLTYMLRERMEDTDVDR